MSRAGAVRVPQLCVGALLAVGLALSSNAQVPPKPEGAVRVEQGTDREPPALKSDVRLLGGTVCLPGTGMVFFSGPPERRETGKARSTGNAREGVEPASNTTPETEQLRAQTDPHAIDRDRVNGVVQNMPEFQKAFACPAGKPLVPANACRVW